MAGFEMNSPVQSIRLPPLRELFGQYLTDDSQLIPDSLEITIKLEDLDLIVASIGSMSQEDSESPSPVLKTEHEWPTPVSFKKKRNPPKDPIRAAKETARRRNEQAVVKMMEKRLMQFNVPLKYLNSHDANVSLRTRVKLEVLEKFYGVFELILEHYVHWKQVVQAEMERLIRNNQEMEQLIHKQQVRLAEMEQLNHKQQVRLAEMEQLNHKQQVGLAEMEVEPAPAQLRLNCKL